MTYSRFFCPSPKVYPEALRSTTSKHGVCTKERGYLPRHRVNIHLVLLHKTEREENQGKGKISKQLDRTAEVSTSLRDDANSSHTYISRQLYWCASVSKAGKAKTKRGGDQLDSQSPPRDG